MATIKELEGVEPGGTITVQGEVHLIEEVDQYELGDFKWLNLVSQDPASDRQIVFEVAEDAVRRWDEVDLPVATVDDKTLEYDGEKFERDETGTPDVSWRDEEGTEEGKVSYSVLKAESGNKLSVERDEDGESVYLSRGMVHLDAIQVS